MAAVINANTNSQISSAVTTINSNTDSKVLTASSSLVATIPTAVWANTTRSLTTFGTLVSDIWSNGTRTLTSGAGITASDVWTYATRNLTSGTLDSGTLALQSDVTTASSSLSAVINANTNSQVSSAVSSINANTNTASSSIAAVVQTNTDASILNASTSIGSVITSLPANVWSYSTRTLSSFGTLVSDIWTNTTRSLTSLTLSSQSPWSVSTSDFGTITAGQNYLATVHTIYNGTLTDSANTPTVTIYDPSRNVVVNGASMTRTATGTYTYSYTTSGGAEAGTWESVFSATVESGHTLPGNDYWEVVTTPAQVIINSISDDTVPQVAANVTITNEGLSGNEYQYEWCVVSNVNNSCGGGDDVFHAVAAKYINAGEDFNTTLTADVQNTGNYYFKVIVYFGTDSSGASRTFTAINGTNNNNNSGGGGSAGGGGGGPTQSSDQTASVGECRIADLNCDGKVNSIDFSIILYFWKSKPPFKNKYVDINKDDKIDSVDFSIMLYRWSKK